MYVNVAALVSCQFVMAFLNARRRAGAAGGGGSGGANAPAPAPAVAVVSGCNRDDEWYAPVHGVAFMLAFIVRAVGAVAGPVSPDCDEVFNFWEPTHYVMYGRGLQTWEYRHARTHAPAAAEAVRRRLRCCCCPQPRVCTAVIRVRGAARCGGPGRADGVDT